MYSKTHTRAIVLEHHDVGEASRAYRLFTREFGTIFVRAQGPREMKSRHRYAVQILSVCDVSMVKTKSGWRLTNVTPQLSLHTLHRDNPQAHALLVRVLSLVKRMFIGEERGSELFDLVWNGLSFLETGNVSQENLKWFEALFVLRILNVLGYVQDDPRYTAHLSRPADFSLELIESFAPAHRLAVGEINRALEASHL